MVKITVWIDVESVDDWQVDNVTEAIDQAPIEDLHGIDVEYVG